MDFTKYVNVEIGTNSTKRLSSGNTLPLLMLPFSMQALTIENELDRGSWFYNPNMNVIDGLRITQQPSPWIKDYGYISFLPVADDFSFSEYDMMSAYTKELKPNCFRFKILRVNSNIKAVPFKRGFKVLFESENCLNLAFKVKKGCVDQFGSNELKIKSSIIENENNPNITEFCKYYSVIFNGAIETIEQENDITVIKFNTGSVEMTIASSFIDFEYSKRELSVYTQTTYCEQEQVSRDIWNSYLGKFKFKNNDKYLLFYSNLYRALLYPFEITEKNEDGLDVYFSIEKNCVCKGEMITGIGFWDVYRTSFPFYQMFYNEKFKLFIRAIMNYYRETGWLPRWLSPGEVGCMPSTLCDITICSALLNNDVEEDDVDDALKALEKDSTDFDAIGLHGREKLCEYVHYGYIPNDLMAHSVSTSMDYYYCDMTILNTFKKLKKVPNVNLEKRRKNAHKLFSENHKMFISKNSKGEFNPEFVELEWGTDFCESSALQNIFNIPCDIDNLEQYFKNESEVVNVLKKIENTDPIFITGLYGNIIHEQAELNYSGIGQVAISNQPSFIIPYVYLIIGRDTDFYNLISKIDSNFDDSINGYPGDEDNGSLSTWVLWRNLGMYPIDPGRNKFVTFESPLKECEVKSGDEYVALTNYKLK